MKNYGSYRDSGILWLGSIPTEWQVISLKFAYEVVLGKMLQPEQKRGAEQKLPYLRAANIQSHGIDFKDVKKMWFTSSEVCRLRLLPGDLLVSEGGDVGRPAIWSDKREMYFQNSINRIRPRGLNSNRFLYYWIVALKDKGYVDVICNKSTIAHFTAEKVASLPLPLPSHTEQRKIADFLSYETAKIDALIDEQKRLIDLLKEKRQAVISHAVTKGLNPDAPMKDSGVEFIGEVPEHWKISPLKYKCKFKGGGTPSKENLEFWSGNIPWVSPKDMKSFKVSSSIDKISEDGLRNSSTSLVPASSMLIVARSGILQRTIPVAINTLPVSLNQDLKALTFKNEDEAYFCAYFFVGLDQQLLLELRKQGATVESLEQEYLENCPIPWPPNDELILICSFVKEQLRNIDGLVKQSNSLMSTLKERRSALISAAVTGKIDVRDWQPPQGSDTVNKKESAQTEMQHG